MAESDSNCGNCRFFRNQQIMGICRYSPQQQNKHHTDWCGQHQAAQVEVVKLPVYDIMTDETKEVLVTVKKKPGRPKKC
jgi:hypothetical protein